MGPAGPGAPAAPASPAAPGGPGGPAAPGLPGAPMAAGFFRSSFINSASCSTQKEICLAAFLHINERIWMMNWCSRRCSQTEYLPRQQSRSPGDSRHLLLGPKIMEEKVLLQGPKQPCYLLKEWCRLPYRKSSGSWWSWRAWFSLQASRSSWTNQTLVSRLAWLSRFPGRSSVAFLSWLNSNEWSLASHRGHATNSCSVSVGLFQPVLLRSIGSECSFVLPLL